MANHVHCMKFRRITVHNKFDVVVFVHKVESASRRVTSAKEDTRTATKTGSYDNDKNRY